MNLPNKLTMLRIILVPVFVVFVSMTGSPACQWAALGIFVAASFTDMLDGRIARAQHLVTDFGKFMDPIADKLLVMSALIMLVDRHGDADSLGSGMPAWVCIVMLSREFIVSGFRLVASTKGKVIAAGIWGKLKTVTQMVYIPMALLIIPMYNIDLDVHAYWKLITTVMMYVSMALTVWSGFWYIWQNREYLKDM
ncbi:MAG: CDP-diacylglycerol--glycerol-3-phosphate 3-phosphatidyltransferase [Clostridia bacterium]|nr:CDP-diacylglycerol--glycerol-3-phosphate 3-phosphatidyltransferase [Clostridia bacterium]MBR5751195.1 CDP-diacylglycerol--glycerol-3-phosphate 3-phosphatidyltransferase [Clostridia bacterium]